MSETITIKPIISNDTIISSTYSISIRDFDEQGNLSEYIFGGFHSPYKDITSYEEAEMILAELKQKSPSLDLFISRVDLI